MVRRAHLPEEYRQRRLCLDAARRELEAVRAVVGTVDGGALPACVHLARAATLVRRGVSSIADDGAAEHRRPSTTIGTADQLAELPGLSERQLERWWSVLPIVLEHAELSLPPPDGKTRELDRAVRAAHDLLLRSLAWSEAELRRRFPAGRRVPTVAWAAGAVVLVAAAVTAVLLDRGGVTTPPPPAPPSYGVRDRSQVDISELATPKEEGSFWDGAGNVVIAPGTPGLLVTLGAARHDPAVEISVDNNDRYRLDFSAGDQVVGSATIGPSRDRGGLAVYRATVPAQAAAEGYDAIRIVPVQGDGSYSVGHLRLLGGSPRPAPSEPGDDSR